MKDLLVPLDESLKHSPEQTTLSRLKLEVGERK